MQGTRSAQEGTGIDEAASGVTKLYGGVYTPVQYNYLKSLQQATEGYHRILHGFQIGLAMSNLVTSLHLTSNHSKIYTVLYTVTTELLCVHVRIRMHVFMLLLPVQYMHKCLEH